jgi:hypothetical protein
MQRMPGPRMGTSYSAGPDIRFDWNPFQANPVFFFQSDLWTLIS